MLEVRFLSKSYCQKSDDKNGVWDLNFLHEDGCILGFCGKSGSGKSTTANCIAGLLTYDKGEILFNNENISRMSKKKRNLILRTNIQILFQNSQGTLHPKKTIRTIFKESMQSIKKYKDLKSRESDQTYISILHKVGLVESPEKYLEKTTNNLSGGEIQRVCIARALLVEPTYLIADEPVSSLDVTKQATILNLLKDLNTEGLSILFISHNLAAAHYLCDYLVVMKEGRIVEQNRCDEIFYNPREPYTIDLIEKAKLY